MLKKFHLNYLYGMLLKLVLSLRHFAFNRKILHSSPWRNGKTIVVGNLEFGGSGKTPHTLFLLHHLATQRPLFLSRGYGRKTSGFQLITSHSTTAEIGDEPKIIAHRFGEAFRGGVCENRHRGLEQLHEKYPDSTVAVLDDALQHRKLQPHFSTLLTPYSQPFWENKVFPKGSLRDLPQRAAAASIIIVTGTPLGTDPSAFLQKAPAHLREKIIFSSYQLLEPVLLNGQGSYRKELKTLAVSGIARNHVFGEQEQPTLHLRFRDHHRYTARDLEEMQRIISENQLEQIITTEKDAVKLLELLPKTPLSVPIFYRPLEVVFPNPSHQQRWLSEIESALKS